ncbi:MAG: toll/interleukin-1 receptor domain-containing protein [Planctomycetales bacterium]|nr:toll/interleukin-1 receptor domain-containing protein [Planctomycetales bacterium]
MGSNLHGPSAPHVFISYAKQDEDKAEEIFQCLERAGTVPWLDKRRLVLGDDWEQEIKNAVLSADAVVVCLRPGFDDIGFRQQEVRWAIEALQKRPPGRGFIIPFIIEPCSLPDWCQRLHAGGDISKPSSLDDLLKAVGKHCKWVPPNGVFSPAFDVDVIDARMRLSEEGCQLLEAAAGSKQGEIFVSLDTTGYAVEVDGRHFVTKDDNRSAALWKDVISHLIEHQLIEQVDDEGEVFEVSHKGFQVVDPKLTEHLLRPM